MNAGSAALTLVGVILREKMRNRAASHTQYSEHPAGKDIFGMNTQFFSLRSHEAPGASEKDGKWEMRLASSSCKSRNQEPTAQPTQPQAFRADPCHTGM